MDTIKLKKSLVRDKVLGCYIGGAIGLGSGYEYVMTNNNSWEGEVVEGYKSVLAIPDKYWEPNGVISSGSIGYNPCKIGPVSAPRVKKDKVVSDDDMHVDILNQFILRDYNGNIGSWEVSSSWDKYEVSDVGGGEFVTRDVRENKYFAPFTGEKQYGCNAWWVTESWIENETLGIIFPYMPQSEKAYAKIFTGVQGDGYCVYLGKLSALMQCLVYQYNDVYTILEKAFESMDRNNPIYYAYKYVLAEYKNGTDWRKVNVDTVKKFTEIGMYQLKSADHPSFSIVANASAIFIALIYGENDYEKTIKIASLCNLDGDCTTSTVGGILGGMLGFNALPKKYKEFLNGKSIYVNYTGKNGDIVKEDFGGAFAYCGKNFPDIMTFDEITDLAVSNLERQVELNGGKVCNDEYEIAVQPIDKVKKIDIKNAYFESGVKGWTFTGDGKFEVNGIRPCFGKKSAFIYAPNKSDNKLSQVVSLQKNHRYRLTVFGWGNLGNIELFAGKNYRSFKVKCFNDYIKYDMTFTATENKTEIGVKYITDIEYNNLLTLDGFSIEDITSISMPTYKVYNIEELNVDDLKIDGNVILMQSGDIVSANIKGKKGYQTIKVYCKNIGEEVKHLAIYRDDMLIGRLPIPPQYKDCDFNEANCQQFDAIFTKDSALTFTAEGDIMFNRIEVSLGNKIFKNKNKK